MPRKLIAHRGSYKLVALSAREATLYIYGDIGKGWWSDTGIEALDVINALQGLQADTINVRIASDGGSVNEGLAIFNALRRHPARIVTYNDSIVASIASVIFCAGDERVMPRNTMAMLHGVMGDGGIGNAAQIRERADQIDQMSNVLVESYIAAVGEGQRASVTAMLVDGKDHYLTAEECLALGICTSVQEPLALAAIRRVDLSRLTSLPAAAAVFHLKEPAMNWKLIALALGLSVPNNAADSDLRSAIVTYLKLADTATDAEVEQAAEQALASRAAAVPPATPPTAVATPAAAVAAPGTPSSADRARGMLAAAMRGQESNARLVALQRQTDIEIAAGRDVNLDTLRTQLVDFAQSPAQPIAGRYSADVSFGEDQRDKRRVAAVSWLLARASVLKRGSDEARNMGANPFRGMNFADMARACLEDAGINTRGMNRHAMFAAAITNDVSDFPNIFENALHKTVIAGAAVAPTTWDKICKITSLSDFRPHIRYRSSSLGDLQLRNAEGEFVTIQLNDAERESITAKVRGGIVNVSREMLANDDLGIFTDLAMELGKASSRTREKALYVLLAQNAGFGPTLGDGVAMFHATHKNISASAGAPSVSTIDADRQLMAAQTDPSGNDVLDIAPSIWLGPKTLGSSVRVINLAQYDPDTPNKLQKPNAVVGAYDQIVDTARLTGTPWFSFADPNIEPMFEMGFVDGQQEPQLAMEEAFTQHGMKWRIVDEWGMAGVGFRGGVRNAGQ
ncbi:MAG TPA: head maturation protease, ClpP-related [Steroidobacteraceae bacterium]|nr:head maturation protease, ClpP-related [Steroidobacteraceae bacterium]